MVAPSSESSERSNVSQNVHVYSRPIEVFMWARLLGTDDFDLTGITRLSPSESITHPGAETPRNPFPRLAKSRRVS